jgi:hypothetical protein
MELILPLPFIFIDKLTGSLIFTLFLLTEDDI